MTDFDAALDATRTPDDAFAALQALAEATVGAKLFTIMVIDTRAGLARRAYSSDPVNYPAGGTKPVVGSTRCRARGGPSWPIRWTRSTKSFPTPR